MKGWNVRINIEPHGGGGFHVRVYDTRGDEVSPEVGSDPKGLTDVLSMFKERWGLKTIVANAITRSERG